MSLGGNEALALAAQAPERVRSVTASGSFAFLDETERAAKLDATVTRAAELGMPAFADTYIAGTLSAEAREKDGHRLHEVLAATPPEAYAAAARRCFATDLRPLLPTVHCPVLLLVGEHDTRTPRSSAERIATGLAHSRIQEIPGAGHLANVDEPRLFATTLRAFWDHDRPANVTG